MNKLVHLILLVLLCTSCSKHNKGLVDKKEFSKKKPPSLQIAEEYEKKNKKYAPKTYKNPKRATKALEKQSAKHKKKGDRYLKKRQKQLK